MPPSSGAGSTVPAEHARFVADLCRIRTMMAGEARTRHDASGRLILVCPAREQGASIDLWLSSLAGRRALLAQVLHVVCANKSSCAPSGASKFVCPAVA